MSQATANHPDVLEVAFVPTVDDLVGAMRATIYRGGDGWGPAFLVVLLLVTVVAGFARHGTAALSGTAGLALLVLVVGIAAYQAGPVFARWALARRAAREPGLLAPVSFRFGPDGVRVKSGGVTTLPWSAIVRVRETRRLFFFELGGNDSLYVPWRVLSVSEQAQLRKLLVARLGARARVQETNGR